MSTEAEHRLPRSVVPRHYRLRLEPDLVRFTFSGREVVEVTVNEPVDRVTLNAIELDIDHASLQSPDGAERLEAGIEYDETAERVTLTLPTTAAPGEWELHLGFRGTLNDKLHGFYRSSYQDAGGATKVIATTQFEATDARRAFPCWDEPDLKATFGITLVVPEGLMAISNAPAVADQPAGAGKREVVFADTIPMSTYLVAFVVGEFEATDPVDVDGVPLRIVYPPGKETLTAFALDAGAHALRFLAAYYDIPYPGEKVDMIAIPDFAWGAMENLGAITYRETALLIDPERATQGEMQRVAAVVAHELAHMWFGDLVTMKWRNGIWLNEAFATFMENKTADDFRPAWKLWLNFAADRDHAMEVDALGSTRSIEFPVGSPAEANAMFDTLTYDKGSAVLRMLELYLGEEVFRRGVADYLKKHAYANSETDDLWEALEAASGEPVRRLMRSWIDQGGFPEVSVSPAGDGYRLSQRHFRYLGGGANRWKVPVLYRTDDGVGRIIVDEPVTVAGGEEFLVNALGSGFYRTRYAPQLLARLSARIESLEPAERFAMVADTWANVLADEATAGEYLRLVFRLGGETEPVVWGAILGGVGELDRIATPQQRPRLQAFVRDLLQDVFGELEWTPRPGEGDLTRRLRGSVLAAMAVLGDDAEVRGEARAVFEQCVDDPRSVDGNVANAALAIVAEGGGLAEFEELWDLYLAATIPQEKQRYLRAAAGVPNEATAAMMVDAILSADVPRQDAAWVGARLLAQRDVGATTWGRMKKHWDDLLAAGPPQAMRYLVMLAHHRSEPDVAADIAAWLTAHPIEGADKHIAQALERLDIRVALRAREGPRLADAIPGPLR